MFRGRLEHTLSGEPPYAETVLRFPDLASDRRLASLGRVPGADPALRVEFARVARSRRTPRAVALRARTVLITADGIRSGEIGDRLEISQPGGALPNVARPGGPRSLNDQGVAELHNRALQTCPVKQTHWSVRSFAAEASISKDMAHRLFVRQAWRCTGRTASNSPTIRPPSRRCATSRVDEKSQIQALERTQPMLPMGLGYVEAPRTTTYDTEWNCDCRFTCSAARRCTLMHRLSAIVLVGIEPERATASTIRVRRAATRDAAPNGVRYTFRAHCGSGQSVRLKGRAVAAVSWATFPGSLPTHCHPK